MRSGRTRESWVREWATVALLSAEKVEFIVVTLRRRRPTLAGQLFALQLAIIVVVLVAVAGVSLAQAAATFERVEGRRVAGLAEQIAVSPLVRANLAEPETRTGLATLAQSLVTQTGVSSVSFAETDLDVRVSTDPSIEGGPTGARQPSGRERRELVGHPRDRRRRPPRLAGAGARRVRGCRRRAPRHGDGRRAGPVDVGAAAGHLVLPAHLPRHRARRRAGRVLAALPPDQAPDSRDGAARDRRPRRAPRGDAARHRRRGRRPRPPAPHHPGQRGGAAAARPSRARHRHVDRRPAHRGPAARGARRRELRRRPEARTPASTPTTT